MYPLLLLRYPLVLLVLIVIDAVYASLPLFPSPNEQRTMTNNDEQRRTGTEIYCGVWRHW
ncbi:hypothetical protein EX30DRAFT_340791 [Ascodesmis nigricans]|uniref:Uncharacterized protein n=1 Tax=Ascodesmis nigricans TaxID=341454 RepID=A0A4S2MXT9_9PEZI|nr:hypothetical protein EX30DRAFT_340791 [Ascodesmis nigricans]